MTKFPRALVYLIVFAVFCVGGGLFISNAIVRPVDTATTKYTADFTSVAGLKVGSDVRVLGARIGKVTDIAVHHDDQDGASVGRVEFEIDTKQKIYDGTRLAIRYLNLTGIRYVDVQQPTTTPGVPIRKGQVIGTDHTDPSFDVTRVFHGLAPVFATMNTEDINHFSESLLAVIEGDGSGFSEFVASLTKVVRFADDRAAVINTLVDNLAELSGSVAGRSQYITPIIDYVSRFGSVLAQWTPSLRELADNTGALLVQADDLLASLGVEPNGTPDASFFLAQAKPTLEAAVSLLSLAPVLLETLNTVVPAPGSNPTGSNPTGSNQAQSTCTRGRAEIPKQLQLFIRESQVTLCKR
ncbi:MCE family protein [Gordonia sp. HY285]|uniref:MCE family protein n=1 Tax=Gordonia liuliyuniae TaxID=2911517 RepID=UPI001F40A2F5|nr:MCE family protein [Gordonia liuliyuniae]MCF8609870.1 MCE family protein [Gordonia liuliyuniae]